MKSVKPIYIKLLLIAITMWIINMTICITDMYFKVGKIEHTLVHTTGVRHRK